MKKGRQSTRLVPGPGVIVVGAIDIGGTKIAVGVIDDNGKILQKLECPTEPERGFQDAFQRMQQMLKQCVQTARLTIQGIGVGSAGPIDPFTGIYGRVDNLATWEGSNLMEPLEREFGVRVAVENDGDAAALAEAAWGVGRAKRGFIYVTISTGIGGGMVLDGNLYRGVDNAHPEIGHFVIEASGPVCYCGARGCWEFLAAGPAMVAWMRANAPPGATLPGDLSAKEICRLAEQGDPLANKAVEQEGYYIGVGLSNLIMMFCPDVIALGGGVMNSAHLFMDRVRQVIRQNCTLVPAEKTELLLASMGADTGLAGAARAWYNRFGKKSR